MISNLIESLGGKSNLVNNYPMVLNAVENLNVHDTDIFVSKFEDSVNDFYMNIEEVYSGDEGIGVFVRCSFIDPKPLILVNIFIKDKNSGEVIDSFVNCYNDKKFIEDRFLSSSEKAKEYRYNPLEVVATFSWSEDGNSLNALIKTVFTDQYSENESIIKSIDVLSPRAKNKIETIMLYDRSPYSGETPDYVYTHVVSSDRTFAKLHVPFEGKLEVIDNFKIDEVVKVDPDNLELNLILEQGGKAEYNNSKGIIPQFKIDSGGQTLSWVFDDDWNCNLDLTRFKTATIVDFACKFVIKVSDRSGGGYSYEPIIMINSVENNPYPVSYTSEIEKISIRWGCMAKSTEIELEDGSHKLVENIVVGDKIKTEKGFSIVKDVIIGHEKELVHLSTVNGEFIEITNGHVVKTLRGYVSAENLTAADVLVTKNGDFQVKDLFLKAYDDKVYSLELDSSSGIYSNGILTGDFLMQNSYKSPTTIKTMNITPLQIEFKKLFDDLKN
ncbi:MAG: hypothetical protein LBM96_07325 [Methanobrevibacter sp.]|jgi:hypothetical protein|nr:hypothetical protein [Candidatus Methanoflexus mossambicus]